MKKGQIECFESSWMDNNNKAALFLALALLVQLVSIVGKLLTF